MPPRSKMEGILLFVVSVILLFFNYVWNFNLAIDFWKEIVFHMCIHGVKTVPSLTTLLTLWPWTWSLAYSLTTLALLITFLLWVFPMTVHFSDKFNLLFDIDNFNLPNNFEQHGLDLWYFTWVFLITRHIRRYQHLWLCDHDLDFLKKTIHCQELFQQGAAELLYFIWTLLVARWFDDNRGHLCFTNTFCFSQNWIAHFLILWQIIDWYSD